MAVTNTHPEYDATLPAWQRARDVVAGDDAVKAAGERYLPRLDGQSDDEYRNYKCRGMFYNATARTAEGFAGLVFRRPPFVKVPDSDAALAQAMAAFVEDADLRGTTLHGYARNVVGEVLVTGRAGSLVDWEENEQRAYASLYHAESMINWRVARVNGRSVLTLLVLAESVPADAALREGGERGGQDEFSQDAVAQLRVLKLVPASPGDPAAATPDAGAVPMQYVVDLWRPVVRKRGKQEWEKVASRVPQRRGRPLPLIPFVFHGPRHSLPDVDKLPLADVIAANLDHYRLDVDYKHGMHFTALPTAFVSGFNAEQPLVIGSRAAWVTETLGATAGFLEYTGQGLTTFERAMDRDEKHVAVLGARLLESQKRVGETAEAIELRESGENSVLGVLAGSVSTSLTQVLKWAVWWHGTGELPDDVTRDTAVLELNTDFSTKGLSAQEITAVVAAWQAGALSRETMLGVFRRGEVLPEARTDEEELRLIERQTPARTPAAAGQPATSD